LEVILSWSPRVIVQPFKEDDVLRGYLSVHP
jgi:hypothetical protein